MATVVASGVKAHDNCVLEAVTTPTVGAVGTVEGTAATVVDADPLPLEFTARIATVYAVPLTKAVAAVLTVVMTRGDSVVPVSRAFHVVPPFVEYS